MLIVKNLSLRFGKRVLFENVNIEFKENNCYGVIGANGAGKSTFLKILSGEIDSSTGEIIKDKSERISYLKQNHNEKDLRNSRCSSPSSLHSIRCFKFCKPRSVL